VTREELRRKFWGELNVAENTIDRQISEVRLALKGVLPSGKSRFVELARMLFVDNATWSADSHFIYFNGTTNAGERGLFRVSVENGKLSRIADLSDFDTGAEN
jgi:hypothetical protein